MAAGIRVQQRAAIFAQLGENSAIDEERQAASYGDPVVAGVQGRRRRIGASGLHLIRGDG
jgi:hypothetical protein